jgi:hypothetical protein
MASLSLIVLSISTIGDPGISNSSFSFSDEIRASFELQAACSNPFSEVVLHRVIGGKDGGNDI